MKPKSHYLAESLTPAAALIAERDRTKVPDKYKWNLGDIFPDDDAWKAAKAQLLLEIPKIEGYRGTLSSSPRSLLDCFDLVTRLSKEFARLHCYASMYSDQDTRDERPMAMEQEIMQIGADLAAKTSFVQPEILAMGRQVIEQFLVGEPRLEIYRHGLDDILRRKAHTGSEAEEKIVADATLMSDGPTSIYSVFSNAEFPFPVVTMSDGTPVKMDKAAFSLHRAAPDREDRRKVFASYFGKLNEYRRTFGSQLYAEVKKNMFFSRAHRYASCLERALDGSNIPVAVYHGLIDNVRANLDSFHRYLRLRKKILGVDELHQYDLYAPIVSAVDLHYSIEEAQEHVLASLIPLGREYIATSRKAFSERWLDLFPNEGKRSGAYSNGGVYDVHPYILLNYNGKYDDVSTLTHELGHTMHSYLTNKTQPYATADYSIFVAEVASTFNEALLVDYMLKTISDPHIRLSLLGNYLDGIRGTVFRQTQFAEFELAIHETAERGEALTGDVLGEVYDKIAKTYYGHDKGICIVDDEMRVEWANVPHFYYNFYVYQYATSFTASAALSEQVLGGDDEPTARYIELLSAGGSDYPINLLKRAGVDMTTSTPFDLTMKKMNRVMDEMERILTGIAK